jgi:hypothetical protein
MFLFQFRKKIVSRIFPVERINRRGYRRKDNFFPSIVTWNLIPFEIPNVSLIGFGITNCPFEENFVTIISYLIQKSYFIIL